jgi:hypothetical protein
VENRVDKPSATELLKKLDLRFPLGVKSARPPGQKSPQMFNTILEHKLNHPQKIVLARVSFHTYKLQHTYCI